MVQGSRFTVQGFTVHGSRFTGSGVHRSRFTVQGSGFDMTGLSRARVPLRDITLVRDAAHILGHTRWNPSRRCRLFYYSIEWDQV